MDVFDNDIKKCIDVLNRGGLILYPTDTIWGIGCDATNEEAVQKIFSLKQREDSKAMIILISAMMKIENYAHDPGAEILHHISAATKPVTVIYTNGKNVAKGLISDDGTLAIRICKDEFCEALINAFKKPIVSTSANISGRPSPANFKEIEKEIKSGVDFIVQHRQNDFIESKPSSIIKAGDDGKIIVIRS